MYINQNSTVEKKFLVIAPFLGIILVFAILILHGIDEVAHYLLADCLVLYYGYLCLYMQ